MAQPFTVTKEVPEFVIVRVHTTLVPDCVQLETDVLTCAKLMEDPDVVTVTWKVRSDVEVVVTVVVMTNGMVVVTGLVIVSVTVFWARDPVRERVPNIKPAPIITPASSMATVAV